ncbi:MAG: tRNA (N(6)-L-threonylcarbamoyladenosine(37)-C(2))-methylthiotransferase MtaB, partial [Candidatus Krumholzibacteria bacterium]|nr:tRNA (N(6)-L-threonylcarbamoyladenosine(37)-C(2))-methylthiotransferase MtaB [Candidatus Krumholzibacteria bacterium]
MSCDKDTRKTFSITTLGCKLNQYESECIRQSLVRRDWIYCRFEEKANFYIINSCTVTGKSDSRCRNAVRRARRISPDATIIVTGCYAETQPEKLEEMHETDLVLGNSFKESIPLIMERIVEGKAVGMSNNNSLFVKNGAGTPMEIDNFLDHSRAFIKIQEGCNASCSYCIIPRARGKSRSVPAEAVTRQVKILADNGYNEIVLTGIHIGQYGMDLDSGIGLTYLIETLLGQTKDLRIRLSSIEVNEVTDGLIELIKRTDRVASHIHIPLQSGDNNILSAMNRRYSAEFFRGKIEEIASAGKSIAIGTDIIVGFPGETEENFRNTYDLVRELPLSYFHVFSFSPRPGTGASTMNNNVHPDLKKRRSKKLIRLGKAKKREFMKSCIGTIELALIQGHMHRFSKFSRSLTGNYCEIFVKCPSNLTGKLAYL